MLSAQTAVPRAKKIVTTPAPVKLLQALRRDQNPVVVSMPAPALRQELRKSVADVAASDPEEGEMEIVPANASSSGTSHCDGSLL